MMNVVATARQGLAIGLLYALSLTSVPLYADEPKSFPPKPAEQPKVEPSKEPPKTLEQPKASEKTSEPKGPDVKGSAPASPPKPAETKSMKPAEPQKEQSKASDKVSETKGEAKNGASEPAPSSKPPDTKAAEPAKPPPTPIVSIKLALMADPRLFPYEINIDMNGDVATLSGKVGSEAEKASATEIAQGSEGVKSVTNNLEIAKDLPQALMRKKDEAITQYVKDRFGKSKTLESSHFEVKTEDGIVLLSGKTKFLVIALEAAEAARQVPGVKAVKSDGIHLEGTE
jgi:Predicted periplasmic or secreted lipoprotein